MQRERNGSAGAMTLAMKAVTAHDTRRVLRVGWIEGSTLREERIFRDPCEVTLGRNERSTFVTADERAPSRFTLFVPEGTGYRLFFTDAMEGRVARPEGVVTLSSLRDGGRARRERDGWSIALDTQSRGKVTLTGASILFQFVPAPPAMPRPQLPVAIRHRPLARADWTYNACVASFLFLAFGAVSYVEYGYDPVIDESFDEAANNVRLVMPTIDEAPPPPLATPTDPETPTPHEALSERTTPVPATPAHTGRDARDPSPSASHANDDAHRQASALAAEHAADVALNAFARSSEFNPLVGMRTSSGGVVDVFAQGANMTGTTEDLAHAGGVENGDHGIRRNSLAARNDIGLSDQLGRPGHIQSHGNDITTGTTQQIVLRAPIGHITSQTPEVTNGGELPMDEVAAIVRRNLGGVQWCYTEGLRNHPSLQGRIEVHFSIGTSGRVLGAPDIVGFDEATDVRSCIQNRFRSMVFPQAQGGAAEVAFPFMFMPGT